MLFGHWVASLHSDLWDLCFTLTQQPLYSTCTVTVPLTSACTGIYLYIQSALQHDMRVLFAVDVFVVCGDCCQRCVVGWLCSRSKAWPTPARDYKELPTRTHTRTQMERRTLHAIRWGGSLGAILWTTSVAMLFKRECLWNRVIYIYMCMIWYVCIIYIYIYSYHTYMYVASSVASSVTQAWFFSARPSLFGQAVTSGFRGTHVISDVNVLSFVLPEKPTGPQLARRGPPSAGPCPWMPSSLPICRDIGPKRQRSRPSPASMTKPRR